MDSLHGYRAYGLNILSAFDVPFWPAGAAPWDVRIVRGGVPRDLPGGEPLWDGVFLGRRGEGLFDFPSLGRVFIARGEQITVEPLPEVDPMWMANVLAGTMMAAVLYQRGALCLHASAVSWRDRACLIMGPSGAGKSTTASALLVRGGQFMADDVTVVTERDGVFFATPSFPAVRLLKDSHGELGEQLEAGEDFDPSDGKVRMRYEGPVAAGPVPIARICFLEKDATLARPRRVPLAGQERVSALQRSFFRRRMAKIVADPARLAAMSIALARRVDVVRVTRPVSGFALDELCELIVG